MRTSINLLLWTTHLTEDQFPLLATMRDAGYDGVEIPLFEGDESHYKKIRKELDNLGLGCTTVTVVNPDSSPISPDVQVRRNALKRIKWALDMTAILGGEMLCGPYHSPLGVFSGAGPTDSEKKHCVEVMQHAAKEAEKLKVKMAIEYLNRFECYFLTTAADAYDFVKKVNHPSFKMMWDTFHANIEEKDVAKTIHNVADSIIHVHISENDRGTPGSGHVNFTDTFKALHKARYDGWLVIEAFGRALPALAAATRVWRDLFNKVEDVYTQGLHYMKIMWEEVR